MRKTTSTPGGWPLPARDALCTMGYDGPHVQVPALAGLQPPQEGAWLLVTDCGEADRMFTGQVLPYPWPHAHGGDVLIKVSADERVSGPQIIRAQVILAAARRRILVGRWESADLHSWPQRVRPAVAFTLAAVDWLVQYDADLSEDDPVGLDVADDLIVHAAPWTPGPALRI